MKSIKKILVPTDFSDDSQTACIHAQQLAEIYGARADLLHIIPLIRYFDESLQRLGTPFDMEKNIYPKVRKESEKRLQKQLDNYFHEHNRGSFYVKIDRKPSKVIAEHALDNGYDLIVMGAKGSHKTDLVKGTTTEKVIRHSSVPVYVVNSKASIDNINAILVPTDISDVSLQAFVTAIELSNRFDAEIILFHVLELYGTLSENIPRQMGTEEEVAIYQKLIREVNQILQTRFSGSYKIELGSIPFSDHIVYKEGKNVRHIPLKTVIAKGVNAHHEIENYVPGNADLLVMSTHGHSGLAHFFLGSTTEKVAQHVDIPTLTIRPNKDLK